jgi:hypothetical protein
MKLKLKPVVASLVVLGLMSPAFARDHSAQTISTQEAIVDQNSIINTVCSKNWFDRITVGGIASVVGIMGDSDLPGMFNRIGNGSDLYVNNVNLLVDVALSKWSEATLDLGYLGAPQPWYRYDDSTGTDYNVNHRVFVNEFFVTFDNFAKYPVYAKIGKAFVPFGEYNDQTVPWQIESPAQMISMTNGPTAIVGVASDFGFYASIFGLKGDTSPFNSSTSNIRNFGGKIGYRDTLSRFDSANTKVHINLSYIRNVWDSLFFTPNSDSPYGIYDSGPVDPVDQRDVVGGLAAHVDMSYKAFSAYADWVGTLKSMAPAYQQNFVSTSNSSKFWGANVNAAYAFETLSHDSSIGAGIQFSGNGQWFYDDPVYFSGSDKDKGMFKYLIPKWRGLVEYKVNLFKHTDLSLIYAYSKSYDFNTTSTSGDADDRNDTVTTTTENRHTSVGLARLGIRF